MSFRKNDNISVFFPDRNESIDDIDRKYNSDESSRLNYARKDRYYSSHKELYIPSPTERHYKPGYERSYSRGGPGGSTGGAFYQNDRGYKSHERDRYVPQRSSSKGLDSVSSTPQHRNSSSVNTTPYLKSESTTNGTSVTSSPDLTNSVSSKWITKIDPQFSSQQHHLKPNGDFQFDAGCSQLKKPSYKVIYDPELSKDKSKGNSIVYRPSSEYSQLRVRDPRTQEKNRALLNSSKKYKKVAYKSLHLTSFTYDKHSLGPEPSSEIVISGLGHSVKDAYIRNQVKLFGEVAEIESILDPSSGIPLGILKVKYNGSPEKAHSSAKKAVKSLHHTKVEGKVLSVVLNKDGKILNEVRAREIAVAAAKLKINGIEEKKAILPTAPKAILNAIRKHNGLKEPVIAPPIPPKGPRIQNSAKVVEAEKKPEDKKHDTPKEIKQSIKVSDELAKYIKGRAFILIPSKYIKDRISKNDVKKSLETYEWTRVLEDKTGIYIVFNDPKEAKRCFHLENGSKVFSVNLFMEIQYPEGYNPSKEDEDYTHQERDVVEEVTSLLSKELEDALQKDIRTKVIAPAVLEFLNIDNFPHLKPKITLPPQIVRPTTPKVEDSDIVREDSVEDVFSLKTKTPKLPSFKKKTTATGDKQVKLEKQKKKQVLPLSYSLNFEEESDSEFRESSVSTPQFKQEDLIEEPPKKKQKKKKVVTPKKIAQPLLYSSSSEDEEIEDEELISRTKDQQSLPTTPEDDKMDIDVSADNSQSVLKSEDGEVKDEDEGIDVSDFDSLHKPTTTELPVKVYQDEDDEDSTKLDLQKFQNLIKDEEDYELLKEIFSTETVSKKLPYSPDFWAWKVKSFKGTNDEVFESLKVQIPESLQNFSGSQRSQGYIKIPDEEKAEYLPHRKRVHDPLSTIQVDNDSGESSKAQSSRVNRANNRRFAHEVSNFNTENEILTMNQLNKRKKPVSFARSAIHNWGLYALEPIAEREMIIEYVGERIRQQVADYREKAYLKSGIGSSYLFRIDENTVIDATKKGGIARFINHCCVPSCTAKIIKVEGTKRIVIYALRDIGANEELTYDYKFERETNDNERVRCLCGAPGCKGYLN